jgi:hypothetical protein
MNRLRANLAKMSSRERWLVLGLAGGLLASLAAVYFIVMLTSISELEDLLADGRDGFARIERELPSFLALKNKNEVLLDRIRKNPVKSLRLPINAIAKEIVALVPGQGEGDAIGRRMADIIRFSGKTRETPLVKGEKKGKKKKGKAAAAAGPNKDLANLYWVEEEMDFPGVSADAVFDFLGKIAESEDLLYVNALNVMRKSNDPNEVRMSLTVGTIQYIEPTEEEEE